MSKVANIRSVVVVGSGNVAESVALAVADSFALELKQVVARNAVRAEAVAQLAGCEWCSDLGEGDRGVLYPFQTFTAGRRVDFSAVPLFVEGSDEDTTQAIESVANALSQRVYRANSKRRREIHLTGVFACNFVNALYSMATDLLDEREGLPFDVLRPLIEETAAKAVEAAHPRNVQTGPAVRGDKAVAERHISMLAEENQQEIYKLLTDYIWQTSRKI